jgi:hypothetical protein
MVSVVIVNYNSGPYLTACVQSIVDSTYPRKELIIIDNASEDDSVTQVETLCPQVKIVRNQSNLGYSAGGNIGIRNAKGEFVVLMNPDTIVDRRWLDALVDAATRHPQAAFFQPKIVLMDDQRILNSAGNMIHIAGFGVCRGIGTLDGERFQGEAEICYASGACTFARASAVREIGPMDSLFLAYGEDKDWGWRGLMMGWQSIYVPSWRILHKWSPVLGHSPRKFYLLEFERLLSIWKNYSRRTLILLSPALIFSEVSVLLHAALKGWLNQKVRSYVDLFRLRRRIAERRRIVQNLRTVPDRMVVSKFVREMEHPYLGHASAVFNHLISLIFHCVRNSI